MSRALTVAPRRGRAGGYDVLDHDGAIVAWFLDRDAAVAFVAAHRDAEDAGRDDALALAFLAVAHDGHRETP